jgi:hypothetical protein
MAGPSAVRAYTLYPAVVEAEHARGGQPGADRHAGRIRSVGQDPIEDGAPRGATS